MIFIRIIRPVVDVRPPSYWKVYRTFDFEYNRSSNREGIFVTPVFTNNTIELWEFDYRNTSWKQISSIDYSPTNHYDYLGEFPIIELIAEGNNWRIFWAQEVRSGLHEIFTVNYNSTIDEWSAVIQVTNTTTITDDFKPDCGPDLSLLYLSVFALLGVVITIIVIPVFLIVIVKKKRT